MMEWVKRWVRLLSQTPPQVTALLLACCVEDWDLALLLLSRGADPNKGARHSSGDLFTPLYYAASYGFTEVCRRLLANGARLDLGGSTCLLFCHHHQYLSYHYRHCWYHLQDCHWWHILLSSKVWIKSKDKIPLFLFTQNHHTQFQELIMGTSRLHQKVV